MRYPKLPKSVEKEREIKVEEKRNEEVERRGAREKEGLTMEDEEEMVLR